MVTTIDLREFVKTDSYINLLNKVTVDLSLNVNPEIPPSQVFNIEAGMVNKSGLSLEDLGLLCTSDKDKLVKFVGMTLAEVSDDEDDQDKDEDERDEVIEVLPFYNSFLVDYLIRYYLLKYKPDQLDNYLKALRIPNQKNSRLS